MGMSLLRKDVTSDIFSESIIVNHNIIFVYNCQYCRFENKGKKARSVVYIATERAPLLSQI